MKALRRADVVHREAGDGAVVVDAQTMQAYALDRTAAVVFRHCDGSRDLDELPRSTGLPTLEVDNALHALHEAGLIVMDASPPHISRRAALAAGAGIGAALVTTLVLPTPAMAASGTSPSPPSTQPPTTTPAHTSPGGSGPSGSGPGGSESGGTGSAAELAAAPSSGAASGGNGTLPLTGYDAARDVVVAGAAIAAGAGLVASTRKAQTKAPEPS